jgi:predicted Zn-dependent protease
MIKNWTGRVLLGGSLAVAIATLTGLAHSARAEPTVESLTGNAISGVGPYYQDVEDAIRRFADKDYAGALARLERAKKTVPRLAPAEIMMAQLYLDANQGAAAVNMLERAVKRAPQDPEAFVMLAERAVSEGRATEAGLLFQVAAKLIEGFAENPKRKQNMQLRTYTGAATVDESRGNWKEARAKLDALVKLDPHNATAHEKLGRVLFELDDRKGALAEFQAAAEADKTVLIPEMAMALLFKDQVNGEKWLNAAIQKGAKDRNTQLAAARYFLKTNQVDQARKHAEEAMKLDPDNVDVNLVAGVIARVLGDYKTAQAYLSKAHLLSPANGVIVNHLALVLLELPEEENHKRALQFAEINVRQNSSTPEIAATFGWINYRLNHKVEAERAFAAVNNSNKVHGLKMVNPDMGYYMAHFAKDKGLISEAVRLLKDSLNTTEPFAYRKSAQALLAQLLKAEKAQGPKGEAPAAAGKTAEPSPKAGASK